MIDYNMKPFRFWCQKVLPLVYDDSLSYYEVLCKVVSYLNHVIEDINGIPDYINSLVSEEKLKEILSELLDELRSELASANEGTSTTATADRSVGTLVWINGQLYKCTRQILAGDRYVESSAGATGNIVGTTFEELIGNLNSLETDTKTSIVLAINEVLTRLNNEATARENADNQLQTQLQNNINTEIQNRTNADTQLQNNINSEIQNRTNADNQLQNSINAINTRINATKTVLIGDSYNVDTVVTPTWGALVSDYLGNCVSFGYGTRGFAGTYTYYDSFSADLPNITDKDTVYEVIVCGGANDVGQSFADIKSAISNFNTLIKTNFVNAKLKIGFIGWSRGANTIWNTTYKYYKQACEELGIEYLNGVEIPLHNTAFLQSSSGNVHHPNANGSAAIAHCIVNAIKTGDANYEDSGAITITQSGTHLIPANGQKIWYTVKSGLLTIKCDIIVYGNTGGTESGVTPLNNNTLVEIGTIGDGYLKNFNIEQTLHSITVPAFLNDGTKSVPLAVVIWGDGHLGIKQTSGTDITNGFGGHISGFTITMPVCELA